MPQDTSPVPPGSVPEQGQLVLGVDQDRKSYATLTPDRDPKADTAKGRVIIGLGIGPDRQLVVTSLRQESELYRQAAEGMPAETQRMITEIAERPREQAQIAGVKFTVGASAEGEVVDTGVFDARQTQASLAKIEAELAGTPLGRRAQPLLIGGGQQRAEAAKTVAALDEIEALSDELHASLDAAPDDMPIDETPDADGQSPIAVLVHKMQLLDLDLRRLDLASGDPAHDALPSVTTQRGVVRESVDSFRALLDATKAVVTPAEDPAKDGPDAAPGGIKPGN